MNFSVGSFSDCSSSQSAPASLPWHAVLQEQTPELHTGSIPAIKPAPAWAPHSTHDSKRFFQHGLPTGSQPPSGIHLNSAPPWPSRGCRGTAASPWFAPWTEGNLSSGTWISSCPLLLHGPWCLQSCFSHVFSLLSPAAIVLLQYLLPLLQQGYPRGATVVTDGLGPGSAGHGEASGSFHRNHSCSPLTAPQNKYHANPVQPLFFPFQGRPLSELSN